MYGMRRILRVLQSRDTCEKSIAPQNGGAGGINGLSTLE